VKVVLPFVLVISCCALAGCGAASRGSKRPFGHSLTPAQTKRAFAAAGIPLRPFTWSAAISALVKGPKPSETLAGSHNGRADSTWVYVYPLVRDAIRVLRVTPTTIVDPSLRHLRARNVVVEWRGKQDPRVTTAVMDLR
jgi:hypothetical protein